MTFDICTYIYIILYYITRWWCEWTKPWARRNCGSRTRKRIYENTIRQYLLPKQYIYNILYIVYTSPRLIYAIWLTHSNLYKVCIIYIYIFDLSWYVTGDAIYNLYYYYSVIRHRIPPTPYTPDTQAKHTRILQGTLAAAVV